MFAGRLQGVRYVGGNVGAYVRRQELRKSMRGDADVLTFPRERLYRDYQRNWQLAKDGVVPKDKAYYYPPVSILEMYHSKKNPTPSPFSVLASKNMVTVKHKEDIFQASPKVEQVEDDSEHNRVSLEARRFLSDQDTLFVEDGSLGGHGYVRVVTNSPDIAFQVRSILSPVGKSIRDSDAFLEHKSMVYIPHGHSIAGSNDLYIHPRRKEAIVMKDQANLMVDASFHLACLSAQKVPIFASVKDGVVDTASSKGKWYWWSVDGLQAMFDTERVSAATLSFPANTKAKEAAEKYVSTLSSKPWLINTDLLSASIQQLIQKK